MQPTSRRRLFTACLAALHLLVSVASIAPISVWAQSLDSAPPVVEFQPVDEGIRGESQVFTATVSDNESVRSVVLHYRFSGDSRYETRAMQAMENTDVYRATVETKDATEGVNSIQYFIEATDDAGNRTLEGFAFNPIERLLVVEQVAVDNAGSNVAADSSPIPATGMSTRRKVLYGLLGVVAVAVLASASSSDGGSGSEEGVELTVVVEPLR